MKDEIKEILEYLKCEEEYYDGIEEVVLSSDEKVIERDDIELLLDYITNLQVIEKEYSFLLSENAELENKITNLQDKIKQYEDPEDLTLFYMWLDEKAKDKMKQLQEELKYSIPQVQHNQIVSKLAEEKHILQEENKNLKQINEEHRELNGNLRTANSTLCEVEDFMYDQAKEYKARIDRAIEYIKGDLEINEKYEKEQEEPLYSKAWLIDTYSDLLNILQGSDE